jgi:hypothetical protein
MPKKKNKPVKKRTKYFKALAYDASSFHFPFQIMDRSPLISSLERYSFSG